MAAGAGPMKTRPRGSWVPCAGAVPQARDAVLLALWLGVGALVAAVVVLAFGGAGDVEARPDVTIRAQAFSALPCNDSGRAQLRVAIVALVKGHDDFAEYAQLEKRNKLLWKNIPQHVVRYDAMLFHEGNIKPHIQERLAQSIPNVQFRDIRELWESGKATHDSICGKTTCDSGKPVGYKLMCRFYGIQLQRMLAKEGYDYVMRLDDDGFIRQQLPMNMFQLMETKGFLYGYRRVQWGLHDLADQTLIPATLEYIHSNKLELACDPSDISTQHFYNNFYVTKLSFWTRPEVQDYLDYLDDYGGIWRYSWGDSLIMALAVKMFARPHEIVQLVGVDYEHGSHHLRISPKNADWRFRKDMADIPHSSYLCSARTVDLRAAASQNYGIGCQYSMTPVMVPENALCTGGRVFNTCLLNEPGEEDSILSALCERGNLLTADQLSTMQYCSAKQLSATTSVPATDARIIFATISDAEADSRLRRLKQSASANNIQLQVVAAGGKLGKGGSGGKVHTLIKFFSSLPPQQLVVVTDGFDVAYAGSHDEILNRYHEMGGGVIFGAESNFHMTDVYKTEKDRKHAKKQYQRWSDTSGIVSPFKYLQAGTAMGPAGQLLDFYQQAKRWASSGSHVWEGKSEQSLLSSYFAKHGHTSHPHVQLDVCHRLFTVTYRNFHHLTVAGGQVIHRLTASNPLIVHTPGPESAQAVLENVVAVLYGPKP